MNSFEDIISLATKNNWCVDPNCSTCGARDFKNVLLQLDRDEEKGLIKSLASMDIQSISKFPSWSGCIKISLNLINKPQDMDFILSNWLPNLRNNIRLADLVLFHFVRRGCLFAPMSIEMHSKWINECISLAKITKDDSLIESLIYVKDRDLLDHPDLIEIIREKAKYSTYIKKALLNKDMFELFNS